MLEISDTAAMILGGFNKGNLADGFIFDSAQKKVTKRISTKIFALSSCLSSQHFLTKDGTITTIVQNADSNLSVVEILNEGD